MTRALLRLRFACLAVLVTIWATAAHAEPYLAVDQGYRCIACHVNPSGGGLRNAFGLHFARTTLPANPLPADVPAWGGRIGDFVRLGADLRTGRTQTRVPGQATQTSTGLEQFRFYGDVTLIEDRLGLHLDEMLAPGNATVQEAYVRYSGGAAGWSLKGGQFYLPFGWRLQDNTAFVRSVSGIGMSTPDRGVEFGIERDEWSGQLVLSQGPGRSGDGAGHQWTGQLVRVLPAYRIGAAFASSRATAGRRQVFGIFGGLRTGALVWLGEVDLVRDSGYPEGRRTLLATLAELDWKLRPGHNLKLTVESFDPDRRIAEDQKVRHSLVYEYTPIPFVQLRLGLRRHDGIPQNAFDNRRAVFVELHAFM